MDSKIQIEILERLFELKDKKTTDLADAIYAQPVSDYVSTATSEQEEALLFRQYPLLICLSCEIPEAGDYHCDDYSGVPIIVVRKTDGGLAAYINICSHRGARLACDNGSGLRQLRCPYHAWRYSADTGDLIAVPFEEGFVGIDKNDHGLHQLPVVEHGGLVFVKPTQGENIIASDFLSECEPDLLSYGIEGYHHFETRTIDAPINWKLVVDTFLEAYHISTLHRDTIAPILHSNLSVFTPLGDHLRMVAPRKTFSDLRNVEKGSWDLIRHSAIIYILFPNTIFIMQGDHLETWRVYPGASPSESKMYVSLYTPEAATTDSARRYWGKNMDLLMGTVLEEDFPLATNMQKDFSVRKESLIFGRNEPALQYFHRKLAESLSRNTVV